MSGLENIDNFFKNLKKYSDFEKPSKNHGNRFLKKLELFNNSHDYKKSVVMRQKKDSLFSVEGINNGRQIELDIARGLAVIFMIFVHVQIYFSEDKLIDSIFGISVDFFGGIPAAPVFMFLMGVGFVYTRKTDYKLFIKRGFSILVAGYLLNFFRESVPALVDYFTEGNKEYLYEAIEAFIDVDILQFAGLAMLFFGFIKWAKVGIRGIAIFGIIFALINFWLPQLQVKGYFLQAVTGLFWGSSEYSEFPFFTWIFYPILGYAFANLLIRCTNKVLFYRWVLFISSVLMSLSIILFGKIFNSDLGMSSELSYYHHDFFANIVYGLFCFFWIGVLFLLAKHIPDVVINQFKRWSRNVTEIYFIHWIIIGWLNWFFYENSIGLINYLLLTIIIFSLSDLISDWLAKKGFKLV